MPTSANTSAAKPSTSGAVKVGDLTANLPTAVDGTTTGFTDLGYVGDAGIKNSDSRSSTDIKEWGGSVVLSIQTDTSDKFSFKLLEATNVDVLKEIYGASNVTGTLSTGITVTKDSSELPYRAWVFDMVLRDGGLKRICLPCAKIESVGEITYSASDAIGYDITLSCVPDANGATHYEYIKK